MTTKRSGCFAFITTPNAIILSKLINEKYDVTVHVNAGVTDAMSFVETNAPQPMSIETKLMIHAYSDGWQDAINGAMC